MPNIEPGPPEYVITLLPRLRISPDGGRALTELEMTKSFSLSSLLLNIVLLNVDGWIKFPTFTTSVYVLNEPGPLNGFSPCLLTCSPNATPPACTNVLIGVYTPSFSKNPLA